MDHSTAKRTRSQHISAMPVMKLLHSGCAHLVFQKLHNEDLESFVKGLAMLIAPVCICYLLSAIIFDCLCVYAACKNFFCCLYVYAAC
jgi:hypothetical protein